ncbi:formylmethanofuran dehydrogenase subunit C [Methanosarcina acetivorans]|jgi:formylmethanofuran dehydrogenase subunit C|uniref:formylmethanofuran dehydrogenase n=1 Tax=Methanosarcina acetivorans (strain ATCC 35395 / DSM 2834 / JCM 12185 / C2A) TaxID=188937 RepID=Q8TTW8_METAC|nr:formylmethanofuran dehydrogenase subunit C [Methanosarcina acetivorans]AAM03760.1 formylmethanofuran dehydrogenase, subunit C [Methanosarcina acetivorans C2A]
MTEGVLINKMTETGKSAGEMEEVTLIPNKAIDIKLEADVITPDSFAGKSAEEIGMLSVWQGPTTYPLSDFFEVLGNAGSSAAETLIRIKGDAMRIKRIGEGMSAGKIEIEGSAGMHVGTGMKGGEIVVYGDADSWAGMEMLGGLLHIKGNAGDHVGCAYRGKWHGMKGGCIIIEGSARHQLGGGMDGGEILVEGNVEGFCGIRQNGGLIVVKGGALRTVGVEMAGGTIVVGGKIQRFSPGFEFVSMENKVTSGETEIIGEFKKFTGDYAISKRAKGALYVSADANPEL